jgi:hypothetical protein
MARAPRHGGAGPGPVAAAGYLSPHPTADRDGVAAAEPIAAAGQPTGQEAPGAEEEAGEHTPLRGADAERAKAAAQAAVPGATVQEVEREADGTAGAVYEVELARPDGTTVKVRLDGGYNVVGTVREGRDD